MSVPFWAAGINFGVAVIAMAMAWRLCVAPRRHTLYVVAACVLAATGVVSVASGLMSFNAAHSALWIRLLMAGELLQAASIWAILPSLRSTSRDKGRLVGVWTVVLLMLPALWSTLTIQAEPWATDVSVLGLGPLGRALYLMVLIAMVMGMAHIEAVLRGTPDPMRYQIKHILIGIGCLAGFQVYFASQILLAPVWESDLFLVGGVVHGMAVGLMAVGVMRSGISGATARLYISPQALTGSITFIVVGLYLLAVGVLAEWFQRTGREIGPAGSLLTVFIGLIALVLVASSRSTRVVVRDTVARNFYRSKYDYRLKWLEVTRTFERADTVEAILDRLRDLLAGTFSAGRIAVWMLMEADGRFHQVRSINIEAPPAPLDADAPLVVRLRGAQEPLVLNRQGQESVGDRDQALYVPVQRGGQGLLAFIVMSQGLDGVGYGTDDRDLLRAIASDVGLLLTRAYLAEQQTSAAELDAFHRFAAFCLHDLKNLAGKLSLVTQNAQVHGDSPQFQQAAMKTVASTSQQMMDLIGKLSPKSTTDQVLERVDANDVVQDVAVQLRGVGCVPITVECGDVPPLVVVRAAFQQVVHNLIQNAQQAGGESNHVVVRTAVHGGAVQIAVQDHGVGLAPERLRTLFRPFNTTKKDGTGIGLYQCKTIVESYGGTIRVESCVGEGTKVLVELPTGSCAGVQTIVPVVGQRSQ